MGLFDKLLKGAAPAPVDPASLPTDLKELRKLCSRAKYNKSYPYRRKICEVGMDLYAKDQLVDSYSSPNDVGHLLEDMYEVLANPYWCDAFPKDPDFEFRCLRAGMEMVNDFIRRGATADGKTKFDVPVKFCAYAREKLVDYYTENKVCPRNTTLARHYLQFILNAQKQSKDGLSAMKIQHLMEIIGPGQSGKDAVLELIAHHFNKGVTHIHLSERYFNFVPQTLYQAAVLLFQMNTAIIGGDDVEAMLDEYRRHAEAGNAYAQFKLGQFYYKGKYGLPQDMDKGLALLKQADSQGLHLATEAVWNHYYNLHSRVLSKKLPADQAAAVENEYAYWNKRVEERKMPVAQEFAPAMIELVPRGKGVPLRQDGATFGSGMSSSVPQAAPAEEEHVGRFGVKDSESGFTSMNLPDVMTGPHGVTYRRTTIGIDSADYWGDNGESTTIHLSDLGATGQNARNSDGYFYW